MPNYEYQIIELNARIDYGQQQLDKLGAAGWRFQFAAPQYGGRHYVFMREVTDGETDGVYDRLILSGNTITMQEISRIPREEALKVLRRLRTRATG